MNSLLGKIDSTQIELEQNIYQGIKTFPSSLTGEDMEPCLAHGIVLQNDIYCTAANQQYM